jgi:uncharacterized protein (DUF2237 family)
MTYKSSNTSRHKGLKHWCINTQHWTKTLDLGQVLHIAYGATLQSMTNYITLVNSLKNGH